MRTKNPIAFGAAALLVVTLFSGCFNIFGSSGSISSEPLLATIETPDGWDATPRTDYDTFEGAFLQSFEMENSAVLAARSVSPVVVAARESLPAEGSLSSSATVPVWTDPTTFANGSISDYPEPGLTTAYTVASEGSNIYRIVSTTTYPTSNTLIDTYVEEYFVKDVAPLGEWGIEDPIVDASGAEDPKYRERMEVHFDDGSVRYEKIVDLVENDDTESGFAAFDVTASMYYPDFAYPDRDPDAVFSSIVVYSQDIATSYDYAFWDGTVTGALLGVRFYTEHFVENDNYYKGTTVAYERAIETYATSGGTLADQLDSVFVGSEQTTLAETVLRKEVLFNVVDGTPQSSAIGGNTVMRTHVVDTNGVATGDFLVQLLNDDAAVFADWESAPYFVPSGTTADEIEYEIPEAEVVVATSLTNPDGADLPLIVASDPAGSELATLYTSITNGFSSVTVTGGTTNDIDTGDLPSTPGGEDQTLVSTAGVVAEFSGSQGSAVTGSEDPANTQYFPDTAGTVEAWVWVDQHADTAGIVHKGIEHDFSDEGYTLQFWGKRGNVAFGIVDQNPYRYSLKSSSLRLNTGKWYYLVGRWDSSRVYLDIYYQSGHKSYSRTNTIGEPFADSGPLVIGSQYLDAYGRNGFYGFDGKINGVVISTYKKSDTDLQDFYNDNQAKTANW